MSFLEWILEGIHNQSLGPSFYGELSFNIFISELDKYPITNLFQNLETGEFPTF